ncbi:MAG: hypothetical protein JXB00_12395 [Bacteroidales bacterium]|nr:hypothetical protein [Bacteroidales bacterium]
MKNLHLILLIVVSIMYISCNQNDTKKRPEIEIKNISSYPRPYSNNHKVKSETFIKGKVHNWTTDTVYCFTTPFYSPFSFESYYQIISDDSTFEFGFDDIDKPIIFQLTPSKRTVDENINTLMFSTLTNKHYYGQCNKFYTFYATTYLVEPNDSIVVDLKLNSWVETLSKKRAKQLKSIGVQISDDNTVRDYGKTDIIFINANKKSLEYFQKWFDLEDKFDSKIERSLNKESALKNVTNLKNQLLSDLNDYKLNITPLLYEVLQNGIEFAARYELLKYLILNEEPYLDEPYLYNLSEFVEFDKDKVNNNTIITEEYNEFLEFYLSFKLSKQQKKYIIYKAFDKEKYEFAILELPEISKYYYLANNLLFSDNSSDFKNLANRLIKDYPNGELNNDLIEKYQ